MPTRHTAGSSLAPSRTTWPGSRTWIDRHEAGETTATVASSNDHVDAINLAVQTARISAGHVDPHRSL